MDIIKRLLFFLICTATFNQVKGQKLIFSTQGNASLYTLSGKFIEIDSQFYIIPKLDINKKDLKIRIQGERIYIDWNHVKKDVDASINY